jgi:biopolymer transport protein ExbD
VFDRYRQASEESQELNVVPVMNLFMVLIPFLLMGAAFFHIGVIPTSTPQHTPHDSDVPKTPTTVAANLIIKPDVMRVTFSSTNLTPEEVSALAGEWEAPGGEYDGEALREHLIRIKKKYPESTTITVLPHDDLDYQKLVGILDYTREFKAGTKPNGEPDFRELFPVTVFSKLLIAEQKEQAAGGSEETEAAPTEAEEE